MSQVTDPAAHVLAPAASHATLPAADTAAPSASAVHARTHVAGASESAVHVPLTARHSSWLMTGSPAALVSHLLDSDQIDASELERIKQLVRHHAALQRKKGDVRR